LNTRGLNIPFVSFGNVTSNDLFCEKEQAVFDFYERSIRRYEKAVDIGANIGVHSLLMARNGWQVKAYEPDPVHYRILGNMLALNDATDLVKARMDAVSDHFGAETFVRVKGNTTGSHLKGDKAPYGELEEFQVGVVDCRPLFRWADFAKVDCEGHEARLLTTVTADCRCEFMVEVGTLMNAEIIFAHFIGSGYRMWAQKSGWQEVKGLADMPMHHSHGALFIGREKP
jgi:FkbM family methyltransferase